MKTVFNNDMVAHIWANQSQDHARNQNGSMYFKGRTIYSYGDHFPMGVIYDDLTLIANKSYSITTSQHMSKVRSAINGSYIELPNILFNFDSKTKHRQNIEYFKDQINDHVLKAKRARSEWSKDYNNQNAINLCASMVEYIKAFKLRYKPYILPDSDLLLAEDKKRKSRLAKKRKAQQKKIMIENKIKIKEWLNNERDYLTNNITNVYLRLDSSNENVQTSKNANFPLSHAIKALRIIDICKQKKQIFKSSGHTIKLGYFKIDSIDQNGHVKAGCHYVRNEEIELFKNQYHEIIRSVEQ